MKMWEEDGLGGRGRERNRIEDNAERKYTQKYTHAHTAALPATGEEEFEAANEQGSDKNDSGKRTCKG